MNRTTRRHLTRAFFGSMSGPARILFYVGVFCCFAPITLVAEMTRTSVTPWPLLLLEAAASGGLAVLYAFAGISNRRFFPVAIAASIGLMVLMHRLLPPLFATPMLDAAGIEALHRHLSIVAGVLLGAIVLTYISFVQVLQREGVRFAMTQAEIDLARDIHQALVPAVEGRTAHLEWRGTSEPSGAVGGDLVDVVVDDRGWLAYVADVSGHGVAAGVFMGMFKTALRAALDDAANAGDLLTRVHRTLMPLKPSQTFVTVACLHQRAGGPLEYVLAGHPPILHIHAGTGAVTRLAEGQLALGMLQGTTYTARPIEVAAGDLLVVVTDGVTEVFDGSDREYGFDGLVETLRALPPGAPLAAIERAILERSRQFGEQLDDQTLLLVRVA